MTATSTIFLDAANRLAQLHVPVIPIAPGTKEPPHGFKWGAYAHRIADASERYDWFEVQGWQLAATTGPASDNLVILDYDSTDGYESHAERYPRLVRLPRGRTGSGKAHVWLRTPAPVRKFNTQSPNGGKLEVRAGVHYCVCPPSIHPNGQPYTWEVPPWDGIPVMDLGALGIQPRTNDDEAPAVRPFAERKPLTEEEHERIIAAVARHYVPDHRHDLCLGLAGWLAGYGIPQADVEELVTDIAEQANDVQRISEFIRGVRDTYKKAQAGVRVAGWALLTNPRFPLINDETAADLDHLMEHRRGGLKFGSNGTGPHTDASGGGSADMPPSSEADTPDLPAIDAGDHELPRVTDRAWAALQAANQPARLFRYGGLPTRVDRDDHGAPIARTLTEDRLRHELARAAWWYTWTKRTKDEPPKQKPALPPVHVVRDMLAARELPFPILTGIIEAPAFAPDGSLHTTPGYHPAGQTYYAPRPGFTVPPIPQQPTADQVAAARALLLDDLLVDFPFTGDAERAHTIALLLLPFVRTLIDGPTPLHLIEKPAPGTGATLLIDVLSTIATGRPIDAMTEGRDEDEWRKRLTARLRDGSLIILIDNLRRMLDSSTVAAAITSTAWVDRMLGTSDNVRLPVRCAWVATGNNPALSSEMSRRTIRIRLDAKLDRPWLRQEFRHPELRTWVAQHRSELVAAILTLVQAWLAGGRPVAPAAPALGMFEAWARVMGGVLHTAGIPGFLGNLEEFYDSSDTETTTIRSFLAAWWEQHGNKGVGTADLFEIAVNAGMDLGDKSLHSQRIRLGKMLGQLRDRRYQLSDDGPTICITTTGIEHSAVLWRLQQVSGNQ